MDLVHHPAPATPPPAKWSQIIPSPSPITLRAAGPTMTLLLIRVQIWSHGPYATLPCWLQTRGPTGCTSGPRCCITNRQANSCSGSISSQLAGNVLRALWEDRSWLTAQSRGRYAMMIIHTWFDNWWSARSNATFRPHTCLTPRRKLGGNR